MAEADAHSKVVLASYAVQTAAAVVLLDCFHTWCNQLVPLSVALLRVHLCLMSSQTRCIQECRLSALA